MEKEPRNKLAGQCSSLMRAHPGTDYERGWNKAVEAMLRYITQPEPKREPEISHVALQEDF